MDWRDKAACLTVDPELFFPVGNTGPAVDQIEKAKAVCARCTVTESASSTPSRPVRTPACGAASPKTSVAHSSAAPPAPAAPPVAEPLERRESLRGPAQVRRARCSAAGSRS